MYLSISVVAVFLLVAVLGYAISLSVRHAQQKAKGLVHKFRTAFENSFDHMILTDADGVIQFANDSVTKITGYSVLEVIGKTPALWGGRMSEEFYRDFWKTIKTDRKEFVGVMRNMRKGGELYIAEVRIVPILEEGELTGFLGIERDITPKSALK